MTTQTTFTRTAIILVLVLANTTIFAQSWSKTGNAGTDHNVNFIGTTDNKGLRIRTNNTIRINISSTGKVGIGSSSPVFKLDVREGSINTDSGYRINGALLLSNQGVNNIFTGQNAGASNSSGSQNSFYGSDAGKTNLIGSNNTANGYGALYSNNSGGANTAIGSNTLRYNINGSGNTATGHNALHYNTSDYNTGYGYQALVFNTTGNYNTATGVNALHANTNGLGNTANGYGALQANNGSNNTADGAQALYKNISGEYNTAIGCGSLYFNTTGSNNTALGTGAGPQTGNRSNTTALGHQAFISASNQVRIGNATITSIGGYVNWSSISDGRVKRNVKENVPGLAFINALKPVTYNLDITSLDNYLHKNMTAKDLEMLYKPAEDDKKPLSEKETVVYSGFIAQDVEKAAKQLRYDFSGVDAPKNDADVYGLRYAEFVMPLVKAVQELSAANDQLKLRITKMENILGGNQPLQKANAIPSGVRFEQNTPNPFSEHTTIQYFLPQNVNNAFIKITGINGPGLHTIPITSKGTGQVNIDAGKLTPGTYQYSLVVDGKLMETKKMVVIK